MRLINNRIDLVSFYVRAKYMFDQCRPLIEHDSQVFQVCQEQLVHNHRYDIPN